MYSKMELCTMANGREIKDMDMEFKYGLMGLSTKVSGKTTRLMEREFSTM